MSKPTLGIAMVAQNEEFHIPASLVQFYHCMDDVVVVDGGSTDKTVEWAERLGARVFIRPFDRDFSAQKNYAINKLETDWVYLHDPDERLEPQLLELLPILTEEKGQEYLNGVGVLPGGDNYFDCFGFARRNFIDGVQTEIYPDYQYRLFKNYCRYEGRVHENIINFKNRTEVDYKRGSVDNPSRFNILHYKSGGKQEQQNTLYAEIEKEICDD